ncbi:MAG TPA: MBOAT family O-acyltransferase [Candidatus Nanoarchaeia archaeon]|nr:MBOAT family O-acyltransferase [Candidatus Nanoarchaeia archaeon]
MLFNTLQFAVFLAVIVILVILFRKQKLQLSILLVASYYFYYISSGFFFLLLLFSSLLDFFFGRKIYESKTPQKKKFFLVLSLTGSLGILAYFKYADFAIQVANQIRNLFGISPDLQLLHILLPVGISFFTFQTMSYTIDIYRNKLKPTSSFLKFMLFIAFFPQLVAGPIVRASEFIPQLVKRIEVKAENVKLGLTFISWGIVKKVVFADNISPFVDHIFSDPIGLGSIPIILGALAFGIQIYCDFSAYTDIAIGAARIFGFTFPQNFNKPFFATSPANFWKRWHITLSTWLRDYLYIPLGGNRKGKARTYINIMITMLLGGLWHGASWNFVIWGGFHGILLAIHRFTAKIVFFKERLNPYIGRIAAVLVTQYFVFLSWLIFRVRNTEYLLYSMRKYVVLDLRWSELSQYLFEYTWVFVLIGLFIYIHFLSYKVKDIIQRINSLRLGYWFLYITFTIVLLFLFAPSLNTSFIYFQF